MDSEISLKLLHGINTSDPKFYFFQINNITARTSSTFPKSFLFSYSPQRIKLIRKHNSVFKNSIFWDIKPCSYYLLHAGFLLGFFNPEDGGNMFIQNIG
jgi:hypothetical protein